MGAHNKGSGISVLWVAMSRASGSPVFGDYVFEDNLATQNVKVERLKRCLGPQHGGEANSRWV